LSEQLNEGTYHVQSLRKTGTLSFAGDRLYPTVPRGFVDSKKGAQLTITVSRSPRTSHVENLEAEVDQLPEMQSDLTRILG
jgi:hypothetical protein